MLYGLGYQNVFVGFQILKIGVLDPVLTFNEGSKAFVFS